LSWQAVKWVLECSQAVLGSRLVLLSIASHANREGRQSWPSVETICIEARLSRREVQYCLRTLEDLGELKTSPRRGTSSSYELPFVASWLGAQSLRTSNSAGAQKRCKGAQSSAQEGAQSSAPEPFPLTAKEEPSLKAIPQNDFLNKGEPPRTDLPTEDLAEVQRLIQGRGIRSCAMEKHVARANKSAAELDAERRRQLDAMREKGYL
jgi:hypothetical protein